MKTKEFLLIYLMLFIGIVSAQENQKKPDALVSPKVAVRQIIVGNTDTGVKGFTSEIIQMAVDLVSKTGGTVKLTEGTFNIEAPINLPSNVVLSGSGFSTILKKTKGVQTRYVADADYGELKIKVDRSHGFKPGMKVQVSDSEQSSCWNVSTAYITDIQNDIIYIDKGLIRDYRSDKNGLISNASSIIDVIDAENVTISNLKIDGNRSENFFADGCNNAGILILRSKNVTVDGVHIYRFNGEGISWQITEHVTVRNSEISECGNTGLHPGTGSPFSIIENNNIHHNDRDGLFICWRVYESKVTGNKIHNNGRYGICTGHKDTDVVFSKNHIFKNLDDGVNLRGEREINAPHRNTFLENIFENNGGEKGAYGFSIQSKAKDLLLKNNTFRNTGDGNQLAAIRIGLSGSEPILDGNIILPHPKGDIIRDK
jgi:hypothetical protein